MPYFSNDSSGGNRFVAGEGTVLGLAFAAVFGLGAGAASGQVVVRELMYHPVVTDPLAGESREFIELYQAGETKEDLGGWSFDRGITYTFPPGTELAAGGYLVVAKDPAAVEAVAGIEGVLGPYEGNFSNAGEGVRLLDAAGAAVVEFRYGDHGEWPAAADGSGHSLVLLSSDGDPADPRNWEPSRMRGGSPGAVDDPSELPPRSVEWIAPGHPGRLFKGTSEPTEGTTEWTELAFSPGPAWLDAPSGYGYSSSAAELEGVNTRLDDMPGNYASFYVRLEFDVEAEDLTHLVKLVATVNYDDGFVLYLNGERVHALNVSGNPPRHDTLATTVQDYAPASLDLASERGLLRAGRNVLAGQAHNGNFATSSDCIFSPRLTALVASPRTPDDPRREIVINEILASSGQGPDWIELYNPTDSPLDLSGVWLSDDLETLNRYALPAGTLVPSGGYLVLSEAEFGFGLAAEGETVVLSEPELGYVLAAYGYGPQTAGRTLGRVPDGGDAWYFMEPGSPGAANKRRRLNPVVLNELMYHHPEDQQFEYVELRNIGPEAVDLSGWYFRGIEFVFPETFVLPGNGYAVVADDPDSLAWRYGASGPWVAGNYGASLANGGELLMLLNRDGVVMDAVHYEDRAPWPLTPDGFGASLERSCVADGFDRPEDWCASPLHAPSPLTANRIDDCSPALRTPPILSEVHYNPMSDVDDERRTEFVEIYNPSGQSVSLDGWNLLGDSEFLFPADAVIGAGEFRVLAWDPDRVREFYALDPEVVMGPISRGLSNGGGSLILVDDGGQVADSIHYRDDFPWPSLADGFGQRQGAGHSLERICMETPVRGPAGWQASPPDEPTPGAPSQNPCPNPRLPVVVDLRISPTVVTAADAPRLEVQIAHAASLASMEVEYWVDDPEKSDEPKYSLAMQPAADSASDGDEKVTWTTAFPPLPENSIVRYRLQMSLEGGGVAVSPSPDRDAFVWHAYFVDPQVDKSLPEQYHLFLSSADWARLHEWTEDGRVPDGMTPNPTWNNEVPATFVAKGVVYDVTVRHQGSRWNRRNGSTINFDCPSHRNDGRAQVRSWRIRFPSYRKHDGIDILILQKQAGWPQHVSFRMFELAGVPAPRTTWAQLRINGCDYNNDAFQIERPGHDLVARWFGEIGDLFKSQGYTGDEGPWSWGDERLILGNKFGFSQAERYEYTYNRKTRDWINQPGDGRSDVVESLIIGLHEARENGREALRQYLLEHFDVDLTLRYICTINYVGTFDDMFQNHFLYRKAEDGKWCVLPWDMDNTLGGAYGEWNAHPFRGVDESRFGDVGNRSGWWNRIKDSFFIAFEGEFLRMFLALNNSVFAPVSMNPVIDHAAAIRGISDGQRLELQRHIERRHEYLNLSISRRLPAAGLPILEAKIQGGILRLSWPSTTFDYVPQSAPSISGPWQDYLGPVEAFEGALSVILETQESARFFRLVRRTQ